MSGAVVQAGRQLPETTCFAGDTNAARSDTAQSGVGAEPNGAEGDPASNGLGGRCRDTWVGSEGSVTLLFPPCAREPDGPSEVLEALKREVPTLSCVGDGGGGDVDDGVAALAREWSASGSSNLANSCARTSIKSYYLNSEDDL